MASQAPSQGRAAQPIDRRAVVDRHSPEIEGIDPLAPLSVGNGEFAFTADITGLQTFPEAYREIPLCTQAQWGWHTTPPPPGVEGAALRLEPFDAYGRKVGYATREEGQEELFHWLRENPHRLHLGRIGLELLDERGARLGPGDLRNARQRLDLWSGVLSSRFEADGVPVEVETCCHPSLDAVAFRIRSPLIASGRLAVLIAFPYGSPEMAAADWNSPRRHSTELETEAEGSAVFRRRLDQTRYAVHCRWDAGAAAKQAADHVFRLEAPAGAGSLEAVFLFTPAEGAGAVPSRQEAERASRAHWEAFWSEGAALDLGGSTDPRAEELERRIVLSQYLTAVNSAGSLPPQETGLVCNSWHGKFHLEMHWWHAAHFAVWGRLPLLQRSLPWYRRILPQARKIARQQGYSGARWPKMTGPSGVDSPSPIGPLLIWQQPHPILFAEACYAADPSPSVLETYREIVFESAEFMASYAVYDAAGCRYVLGPPLIPAQENHPARETWNPTYELEAWRLGLEIARAWRRRLGLPPVARWDEVQAKLSLPPVADGCFLAHENCPQTFRERNYDHPSMLGALGVLPGRMIDRETMRRTLRKVIDEWEWERTWGWDFPMAAMTAARLGEPETAVKLLLMETPKNRYLPNGHNWQRPNLPVYLPGNGALLLAVAWMAAGREGGPPIFPADGRWSVKAEGFQPYVADRTFEA